MDQGIAFVAQAFIVLLSMILTFGTVVVIFIMVMRTRRRRLELQAEVQSKLIDKFGTAQELVDFLHSRAGREFVSGVQSGVSGVAREKVASGFKRSILVSALGLAFLVLWGVTGQDGLAYPGVLLLALGLAYFGASYVSLKMTAADVPPASSASPTRTDLPADV